MTHQDESSAIRNLVNLEMEHGLDMMAAARRRLKSVVARSQKTAPQLAAWFEQTALEAVSVPMIPLGSV